MSRQAKQKTSGSRGCKPSEPRQAQVRAVFQVCHRLSVPSKSPVAALGPLRTSKLLADALHRYGTDQTQQTGGDRGTSASVW